MANQLELEIRAKALLGDAQKQISTFLKEIEDKSDGAGKKGQSLFQKFDAGVTSLAGKLGPLGGMITGAFAAGAIISSIKAVGDYAGQIDDLAKKSQMTAEQVQRLKFAVEQSGGSFETIATASARLAKQLIEGDKSVIGAIKTLGIDVEKLRAMSPHDIFVTLATAIGKVKDPTLQSALALQLFGRSGAELLPMIKNDLPDAMSKAVVMSDGMVSGGDRLGDSWDRIMGAGKAILASVLIPLAPALELVAGILSIAAGGFLKLGEGLLWIIDFAFKPFNALINAAIKDLQRLGEWLGKVTNALVGDAGLEGAFKKVQSPFEEMVKSRAPKDLTMSFEDAMRVSDELTDRLKKNNAELERMGKLRDQAFGLDKVKAAQEMVKAIGGLAGVAKMSADQQDALNKLMNEAIDAAKRNGKEVPLEWLRIWDATNKVRQETLGYVADVKRIPNEFKEILGNNNFDLQKLLLGSTAPNVKTTGTQMLSKLGFGKQMFEGFGDLFKTGLPDAIMGAFQGGGNVGKSVGSLIGNSLGGNLAKAAGGFLTKNLGKTLGGALGSVLPGLGTIAGSFLGEGISKLFGGLFGGGEKKKVEEMRQSFIEAAGGIDVLRQQAAAAGVSLDALMSAKKVKDFEAAQRSVVTAIEAQNIALQNQALLTDAQAQRQELLNQAVQRYGFTIEELGPAMQRQMLAEQAETILQDFQLLTESGINVDTVIGRMSESINEFVQHAIRTGTEVPEAMRPIIEKMIEQGKLTDEQGNKITDLKDANIKFGESLTEMFKGVLQKLDELIAKLNDAAKPRQGRIDITENVTRRVREERDDSGDSVGREHGAAAGGLFSKPTFRVIAERKPEVVGEPDAIVNAFAQAIKDTGLGASSNGSDPNLAQQIGGLLAPMFSRLENQMSSMPRDIARATRDAVLMAR